MRRGGGKVETQTKVCATLLLVTGTLFAQADPKSASVEGVVTNAITGEPVAHAHVSLDTFDGGKARSYGAASTAEGKFAIAHLPAGSYTASVERAGFAFNPRAPVALTLKADDHQSDVKLKLTPTGTIAGTVVDAEGEPVENCGVTVELRLGTKATRTDAHGRFRIGGLTPGKYRLKARADEPETPPEIRTDGTVEDHYGETYYPSSLDQSGASKIAVRPGSEASGIQVRLVRTPIVRVSGKVTGIPPGAEHVFITIFRKPENEGGMRGYGDFFSGGMVKKDGTFTRWGLSPGTYGIGALWVPPPVEGIGAPLIDVVVGDSNVDGIEIRVVAPANLTGQVEYESDDAKPTAEAQEDKVSGQQGPRIWLDGADGMSQGAGARPDASGAFAIEDVPAARYQVRWLPRGYVKSMRLGTEEIEGNLLDLTGGAGGAPLTITISTQFGSVAGTVQGDAAALAGLKVMLIPSGRGLSQSSDIGADGGYSLKDVVPGTYKVAAIAKEDEASIQQGGDAWEDYAPVIETVTVRAGEKATQDLKVLNPQ